MSNPSTDSEVLQPLLSQPVESFPETRLQEETAEKYALNDQEYVLSPDLLVANIEEGRLFIHNTRSNGSIVVDSKQWQVLQRFRQPSTVGAVLPALLTDHQCPAIVDLFELVLQSHRADTILVPGQVVPQVGASLCRCTISPKRATWLVNCSIAIGLLILAFHLPVVPTDPLTIAAGFLLSCMSLSIGNLLGIAYLSGYNQSAPPLQFCLRSVFPRFTANVSLIARHGRIAEYTMALLRIMPLIWVACILAVFWREPVFFLHIAICYAISPAFMAPARFWLRYRIIPKRFSISHRPLFSFNRGVRGRFRNYCSNLTFRRWLGQLAYHLIWMIYAAALCAMLWNEFAVGLGQEKWGYIVRVFWWLTLAGGCAGLMVFLAWWLQDEWQHWLSRRRLMLKLPSDPLQEDGIPSWLLVGSGTHSALTVEDLAEIPIFAPLAASVLRELLPCFTLKDVKSGTWLLKDVAFPEDVFLPVHGALQVSKRWASGKKNILPSVQNGLFIDFIGLYCSDNAYLSIRAKSDGQILCCSYDDFFSKVLPRLGRDRALSVHLKSLLRVTKNFRYWPDEALDFIIEQSKLISQNAGDTVFREGKENLFFHICMQGQINLSQQGSVKQSLASGGFVGEVELLTHLPAAFTAQAETGIKILMMPKSSFFGLTAVDYRVALFVEASATKRLGKPVFPLEDNRFAVSGFAGSR